MCVRSSLALCIALLLLPAIALAEEPNPAEGSLRPVVTAGTTRPAPERGLRPRVQLAATGARLYGPCPAEASDLPPAEAVKAGDHDLTDHLALNLEPTDLSSPNEAGRRHGRGDVVLSVPLNETVDLRTGVRVDYDSNPTSQNFAAEATPTIGVGLQF